MCGPGLGSGLGPGPEEPEMMKIGLFNGIIKFFLDFFDSQSKLKIN